MPRAACMSVMPWCCLHQQLTPFAWRLCRQDRMVMWDLAAAVSAGTSQDLSTASRHAQCHRNLTAEAARQGCWFMMLRMLASQFYTAAEALTACRALSAICIQHALLMQTLQQDRGSVAKKCVTIPKRPPAYSVMVHIATQV